MAKFGEILFNHNERFIILFALNNLPAHDMKTAQMFRTLKEPLRFDEVTKFQLKPEADETEECSINFELAPQFLMIIPGVLLVYFQRWGFPPPVAQAALDLMDRLNQLSSVDELEPEPEPQPVPEDGPIIEDEPEPEEVEGEPEPPQSDAVGEQAREDNSIG